MPTPQNTALYAKAKKHADKVYGKTTSAYKSMFIVKTYKGWGGKYDKATAQRDRLGTTRWLREEWILVEPFLLDGTIIKCGSVQRRKHACRPLKRITKDTPITIHEAVRKHGKETVSKLASKKQQNTEKYRVRWDLGKSTRKR